MTDLYIPCELEASSRYVQDVFGATSGLVLQDIGTNTRYMVTTGLLAFAGFDKVSVLAGRRQNELIDLKVVKEGAASELRSRHALVLELPPDFGIHGGYVGYLQESAIAPGEEYQTYPNLMGRIVGVNTVIRVPHARADAETLMTRLLRIRTAAAKHSNLAGAVWHNKHDVALAMTVAQNDEFAFALPIHVLLAGLEQRLRIFTADVVRPTLPPTSQPGPTKSKGTDTSMYERYMTQGAIPAKEIEVLA